VSTTDSFAELARFYDPIMRHVDYDRWYLVADALTGLLPRPFTHLDVACGTGVLLRKLLKDRWCSFGVDLSVSMLRAGKTQGSKWPVAAGDLRALPFARSVDYVTCLFDSVNFLLTREDFAAGIRALAECLKPEGIVYFDIVTERMVLDHFAGQQWTERNGKFSTRWQCQYDRTSRTVETRIQVNSGETYTIRERIYDLDEIEDAANRAGIQLLGALDAETWRPPRRKTVRVDYVGVMGDFKRFRPAFRTIEKHVQSLLK
jgi:SAM-dependent methyltransferase